MLQPCHLRESYVWQYHQLTILFGHLHMSCQPVHIKPYNLFVTREIMEGEHAETSGKFGVNFLVSNLLESVALYYAKILV